MPRGRHSGSSQPRHLAVQAQAPHCFQPVPSGTHPQLLHSAVGLLHSLSRLPTPPYIHVPFHTQSWVRAILSGSSVSSWVLPTLQELTAQQIVKPGKDDNCLQGKETPFQNINTARLRRHQFHDSQELASYLPLSSFIKGTCCSHLKSEDHRKLSTALALHTLLPEQQGEREASCECFRKNRY